MGVTNQAPHTENPETSSYKSKKEQREAGPRMGTAQPEQQEGMVGVMGRGWGQVCHPQGTAWDLRTGVDHMGKIWFNI